MARLVSPTVFEVEGWRRIEAIPLILKSFGIDPDAVSLISEEVDLPISVGNHLLTGQQPNDATFIVRLFIFVFLHYDKNHRRFYLLVTR